VVGLPLYETLSMLRGLGFPVERAQAPEAGEIDAAGPGGRRGQGTP